MVKNVQPDETCEKFTLLIHCPCTNHAQRPHGYLPRGDSSRGLGAGGPSLKIPLYAKKTIGVWSINEGGGINISKDVPGGRNYLFGGTIINYEVSKRLTLGPELFSHGRPTADPTASQYAVDLDFGGYYTFSPKRPGFQLMFAYGHSVAGQTENYAYLALYWTWGPKSGPGD